MIFRGTFRNTDKPFFVNLNMNLIWKLSGAGGHMYMNMLKLGREMSFASSLRSQDSFWHHVWGLLSQTACTAGRMYRFPGGGCCWEV